MSEIPKKIWIVGNGFVTGATQTQGFYHVVKPKYGDPPEYVPAERLKEAESLVAGAAGAITRLVQEVFMQRGEQATADIVMSVPLMKEIKAYNIKYDRKNDG